MSSDVGKIYSIEVKNFVTYEHGILKPGKSFNLITGCNGTGKSTFIAAIILGLGASPKCLSRASNIEEYIKYGEEQAQISIKLYDTSRTHINFERSFVAGGKKSWKINGEIVNQKTYIQRVKSFNIQIDNLCQFLPQDRVQDFAKLCPKTLLVNTISSVCSENTLKEFEQLKELQKQSDDHTKNKTSNETSLKEAEARFEELQEKVDEINIRTQYTDEIENINRKIIWMEYGQMKKERTALFKKCQEEEKTATQQSQAYDVIKKEYDEFQKCTQDKEQELQGNARRRDECLKNLERNLEQIEEMKREIYVAEADLQEKKRDDSDRIVELRNATKVLEAFRQDYTNLINENGTVEELEREVNVFGDQIPGIRVKISRLLNKRTLVNSQLDDHMPNIQMLKRQINSLENISEQRLRMLESRFENVYKAVLWVRQNRHMFEDQVYEPMILELNVKDPNYAIYIENTVSLQDLLAFTCCSSTDMHLLIDKLCVAQELPVNFLHSKQAEVCNYRPRQPIEHLKQYGFQTYLINMLEGPAPIMNYLCESYNIQDIPIGNDRVNQYADDLPDFITAFFTPKYKYSISYSKYSREKSSMRNDISAKNILCLSVNQAKLQSLKSNLRNATNVTDKLNNDRTEIEVEIEILEQKRRDLLAQKQAAETKIKKLESIEKDIKIQTAKLNKIKNSGEILAQEEVRFKNYACKRTAEIFKKLQDAVKHHENHQKLNVECGRLKTIINILKRQYSELSVREETAKRAYISSKNRYQEALRSLEKYEREYNEKFETAKSMCDGKEFGKKDFPYKQIFSTLPKDIPSLQEKIEELQARISCITAGCAPILEEYEATKRIIDQLKNVIESGLTGHQTVQSQIESLHKKWYLEVSNLVNTISARFEQFMKFLKYSGKVVLHRNSEYDYDSYGINIMVSYRKDSEMRMLDRFVQSGGERTVATATYTLALQHLTNAPFRCVDEINQGMDPINECKVFRLIVEYTTRASNSQYFYVTPKIVPGLHFNDKVMVHVIANAASLNTNSTMLQ